MKKLLIVFGILLVFSSCADKKTINGITYRPYGILNENRCRVDSIQYEISGEAVFSGIIFSELLFIPTVYTFGYNLYEPVALKSNFHYGQDGIILNPHNTKISWLQDSTK